jgi:hypothetical protein
MDRFVSDFETTTDENDCRVWAYAVCNIETKAIKYGTTINDYMAYVKGLKNTVQYFHNLKFDGEFILVWLFENGFTWVKDKKELEDHTFSTLISDKGAFYSIEVVFSKKNKRTNKVTFYDSLKLLPFSVAELARGFHLSILKGELDYHTTRPLGHELTDEETAYIKNDVLIVAQALEILFNEGLTKMTIGSNAMANFKETVKNFDNLFPVPHYDRDIRQSYRGGFTYLNPRYAHKTVTNGIVLDVNSLYPAVMKYDPMPYGEPMYFEGQYQPDPLFNLYVVMLTCNFELKPDHIPTIQLKNNLSFIPTDYITTSAGEDVTLCLTSVDLALFMDHYTVDNIEWEGGYKFKSAGGMFDTYIDYWSDRKIKSKIEGNHALYILAKLMLNNLYGKFSLNPEVKSKIPEYDEGKIHYSVGESEKRLAIYIPVGTFITAWARDKTIRSAQALYHRFIYADTDSLHLEGEELPKALQIDDTALGAWKWEGKFTKAKFIRAKTYMEVVSDPHKDDYKTKITCAGMPKGCYGSVTFENFKAGSKYAGKLVPKHVKGGIVLKDVDFTIQNDTLNPWGSE